MYLQFINCVVPLLDAVNWYDTNKLLFNTVRCFQECAPAIVTPTPPEDIVSLGFPDSQNRYFPTNCDSYIAKKSQPTLFINRYSSNQVFLQKSTKSNQTRYFPSHFLVKALWPIVGWRVSTRLSNLTSDSHSDAWTVSLALRKNRLWGLST